MAAIIIVGLGLGHSEAITVEASRALLQAAELHLPGGCKSSCDIDGPIHRCSQSLDMEAANLAEHIVEQVENGADVTLGVPGDPSDWQVLLEEIDAVAAPRGIVLRRIPGVSLLSPVLAVLGLGVSPGLFVTTATQLASKPHPEFGPDCSAIVMHLHANSNVDALQKTLLNQYASDYRVALVHPRGEKIEMVEWISLGDLSARAGGIEMSGLFLPAADTMGGLAGLQATVAQLRGPDGCPWDREQTHRSLRSNLLEEAYETLAAIESGDSPMLVEELGDLLLQVVMHTQIAIDANGFGMAAVIAGVNNKLVRRHPHVFEGLSVGGVEDVLHNWENIKAAEKNANKDGHDGAFSTVPEVLPALLQAQTYQNRAARAGFDWSELNGVVERIREEIEELDEARGLEQKTAETGDLLFTLVNLARWLDIDAESALRDASARFRARYEAMEAHASEQGGRLGEYSQVELNAFWQRVKDEEKSR